MAAEIPRCEPISFLAGDTVKWTRNFAPDYSAADGYVLKYAIRGVGTLDVTATTDVDGIGFAVTVASGDSTKLAAGQYQLRGWVELSGEVYTLVRSVITVEANIQDAQAGDLVSAAETQLALVDAQITELLQTPVESFSIGQRSAQKRKLDDLHKTRAALVTRLGRLRGQSNPTRPVRFRHAR